MNPQEFTKKLVDSVAVGIIKNIKTLLDQGIEVTNLDKINAYLVNELPKALKPLVDKVAALDKEFPKQMSISNLKDIVIPQEVVVKNFETVKDVSINNLEDLKVYFDTLTRAIENSLKIEIAAPVVNVPETTVNVPAPIVNVPAVDLEKIIRALDSNLNKIKTNSVSRPLAVRLTDGQEWVKAIKQGMEGSTLHFQALNEVMSLKNAAGQRINPATEESLQVLQQASSGVPLKGWTTTIDESGAPATTVITYSNGGVTVATKTITVSGTTTTITVT